MRRRDFLKTGALATGATFLGSACVDGRASTSRPDSNAGAGTARSPIFSVSLAQWSLHRAIQSGELDPLDFAVVSRREFGIEGVEYVNGLFTDRRTDAEYLAELKTRADGEGVRSVLIMCDGEGRLGDPDADARSQTIDNHRRWIDAASFLGCHSIRVNAASEGDWETQRDLAADGLGRLTEVGADQNISVIVENHGGISSNAKWLAEVMRAVDNPACGTLPDFGNWDMGADGFYDPYLGTEELMPFAKAVSFKTHIIDPAEGGVNYLVDRSGNRREIDFTRLMRTVLDAGYRGFVGVEFEGSEVDEMTGIRDSKAILDRIEEQLRPEYS
jgi:L-ribulose-5-phosphate 3-epimerase